MSGWKREILTKSLNIVISILSLSQWDAFIYFSRCSKSQNKLGMFVCTCVFLLSVCRSLVHLFDLLNITFIILLLCFFFSCSIFSSQNWKNKQSYKSRLTQCVQWNSIEVSVFLTHRVLIVVESWDEKLCVFEAYCWMKPK